jgi:hypothetical protein
MAGSDPLDTTPASFLEVTGVGRSGLDDVVGVCFEASAFERAGILLFTLIIVPSGFLTFTILNDADMTEEDGVPDRWDLSVVVGSSKEAILKSLRKEIVGDGSQ